MNGKYREHKIKNRSRYYILLSIMFLGILFKWGLPAFFNVISGPEKSGSVASSTDNVPPQVPMLSALPEATNSAYITVTGFTEKEVTTELFINDSLVDSQLTNGEGAISLNGTLTKGNNRVQVFAKDSSGNKSQSEVVIVNFDDKPIELTISSPKDGSEYFGSNNQTVDVKGTVSKPDSTVTVNGSYSMVDKDGNFTQRILLNSGENNIKVRAQDKAGNVTEQSLKLVYNP